MRGSNILIRKETCGLAAWVKWQSICIASIQPRVQPPSTTKKIKNKKRKKKKKNHTFYSWLYIQRSAIQCMRDNCYSYLLTFSSQ
jgi:hypothetical protein